MRRGWGRTLGTDKGYARPTKIRFGRTVGSLYAAGLAIVAAAIGGMAVVFAVSGSIAPGVVADDPGGLVRAVDPGGFAWRAGIRPGQLVLAESAVDDEAGWSIETSDGSEHYRATASSATATLRQSSSLAVAAAVVGLFGLVALPTRRRRAELLAAMALALASVPLWLAGDNFLATAAGVLAPLALVLWLLRWLEPPRLPGAVVGILAVALAVLYALARAQGSPIAADLEGARLVGTLGLAAGVLMPALDLTPGRLARSSRTLRLLDAGAAVTIVLAAGALTISLGLPLPIVASAVGVVVAVYVGLRTGLGRLLDRMLLAEVRERAAVQAAEAERARLSRELHDDPLQALAGVIHRLERAPNTEAERAALRTVAAHLRDVATELHPPVLDDLGLIAAIEALRPSDSSVDINISVAGSGYQRAQRPPPEVEIATYRIVQEAIANAIAHSGCRCIRVTGTVGRDEVVIDVADDGRGVSGRDIEAAMRAGHIGVASMRRRADAIDARMTHRSVAGTGTTVSLRWQA
jgi:signal transduction histidine kinase